MFTNALIVDSDEVWLKILTRSLQQLGVTSLSVARDLDTAAQRLSPMVELLICEVLVNRRLCFPLLRETALHYNMVSVLAISARASGQQIFRLHDYGVGEFLEKPFDLDTLRRSLELVRRRKISAALPDSDSQAARCLAPIVATYRLRMGLTGTEADVLRCAATGMTRSEIAWQRCVSVNTVKSQIRSLLRKSGLRSMHELVGAIRTQAAAEASNGSTQPHANKQPPWSREMHCELQDVGQWRVSI